MPTPFTHLETAQRMLVDECIPSDIRSALALEKSTFLLGNVAADARTNGDLTRESTHFYSYDKGITEHPWRVMLQQNPSLCHPSSVAHRVFVAGYVAHLSIDEIWSLQMLGPHFVGREWGSNAFRFLMLHMLLIYMDERDYHTLQSWQYSALARATPDHWLPFMNDRILTEWRDFISEQISPDGHSQTLEVLGKRINKQPTELRAILDSPQQMQSDMWANIPLEVLASVESAMYQHACQQICLYWNESQSTP